ncbi:hypothetical protein CHLRE_17g703101v5 [Chlamydomonas reinhardtii]|uniref:Uncharacterized protein n=1 Tax=Chlamydomonas reinhardtii TaxID=3055 RepID=A0A2K3CP23_CHLRE|nr:uncharacterized protein CHLRE_17g703101v5 [Chlamydomonas reinhardtii]PNW70037.1 hypothetical protein CHLRE_17g703101v5 [Chlamydomonas reinhardtii]
MPPTERRYRLSRQRPHALLTPQQKEHGERRYRLSRQRPHVLLTPQQRPRVRQPSHQSSWQLSVPRVLLLMRTVTQNVQLLLSTIQAQTCPGFSPTFFIFQIPDTKWSYNQKTWMGLRHPVMVTHRLRQ